RGGTISQTIRPVTIRQILNIQPDHNDASIVLDDHELTQVIFVANLRKVSQQSAFTIFTLEDGTGAVEARMSMNDDLDNPATLEANSIPENTYVRVVAHVRSYNNKRQVNVNKIKPVEDMNELTYHFLNVINTHLEFTRSNKASGDSKMDVGSGGMDFGLSNPMSSFSNYTAPSATRSHTSGFSAIQDKVLQQAQQLDTGDEGAHIGLICQQLRGTYSADEIQHTVEFLVNEGHLYSTIDEQHYKCTYANA
ncbi:Replication factor A protein 2, partial [Tieghemiomyces parasiticus]